MKKKQTKASKKKLTKTSVKSKEVAVDLLKRPKNHGEWLKLCIKFTERAIGPHGNKALSDQVVRLKQELADWENK